MRKRKNGYREQQEGEVDAGGDESKEQQEREDGAREVKRVKQEGRTPGDAVDSPIGPPSSTSLRLSPLNCTPILASLLSIQPNT